MARTPEQRRTAQRAQRRNARERQARARGAETPSRLPPGYRARAHQTRHEYLQNMLANPSKEGGLTKAEKDSLASAASHARNGTPGFDPRYQQAWSKYWYHDKETDPEDNEDYDAADDKGDDE